MHKIRLSTSIVTYRSCPKKLAETVSGLATAIKKAHIEEHLYIVDNGDDFSQEEWRFISAGGLNVSFISGHGNIGYGCGHNLAIGQAQSDYHLILNPDVEMAPDAIERALAFFREHPECGVIAPAAFGSRNEILYLCKNYPTILDLAIRGAGRALSNIFTHRLERYELREKIDSGRSFMDPPIISGCFMMFRTAVLKELAGFDPRFFLYFEDFDISLRAAEISRIAYVPQVKIVHHGGNAARKGIRHIALFVKSAFQFFSKHGWKIY